MKLLHSPKLLASITGATFLVAGGFAATQAQELTVVSWGGAYSASQQKAYHDP